MGNIIDGKEIADNLLNPLQTKVQGLKKQGLSPRLTVLMVGEHPASQLYVKNKDRAARKIGIQSVIETLPAGTSEETILSRIDELNQDPANHGILLQLPLPDGMHSENIIQAIRPEKDVDGFHPVNMGKLLAGVPCLVPCTPMGILHLIRSTGVPIAGKDAIVIGRSTIVGKPSALLLLAEHATVTLAHSKTLNLPEKVRRADIVVAAIGKSEFVRGDWIREGAIVIDVGINRQDDGRITGDVEFEAASKRAAFITPVPGGVGPMTIAMLMQNTIAAAQLQQEKI